MPATDEIVILSDADVESLIDFGEIVDALEAVYRELGNGTASVRPRSWTLLKRKQPGFHYGANTLEGGGKDLGYYALRISSVVRRDPDAELGARHQTGSRDASGRRFDGLVLLFSIEDGSPVALIPSFAISRQRVAGTSGVAARALARRDSRTLGVLGSGSHAVSHALTFGAYRLAGERGLGRRIPLDWFLTGGVSEVYGTSYFMQGPPVAGNYS